MVVAAFWVEDKANQVRFLKETFLVDNVSPEVVFEMLFLTLSDADIDFLGWELQSRTYITKEVLPTTRRVKLVDKKEFAATTFDPEHEIYIVYVASFRSTSLTSLNVHPFREPQISGLIVKKAPTKVPAKYSDFANIFSPDLAMKLPKHTEINTHTIDLEEDKQLPYGPIYSLVPVELETLKTHIKSNLANSFIGPSKSPAGAPILFGKKPDGTLCLCINYQGLNNITIKNWYPLPIISESLNHLSRAKQFT